MRASTKHPTLIFAVGVCLAWAAGADAYSAHAEQVPIRQKNPPTYCPLAIQAALVGDVRLVAEIAQDGSVTSVQGSGAHALLCKCAEDDLRTWKFGPFASDQKFPVMFEIVFSYRLRGSPTAKRKPPKVIWKLPGRVEITQRPVILQT